MSQSSDQEYPNCELCECSMDEDSYGGSCCSQCPRHVEHMCCDCSAWNQDETQLLCPECKQAESQPEPVHPEPAHPEPPHPEPPQPNPATRIMAEHSVYQYENMYGDEPEYLDPENIQSFWFDMCQDFTDCYDVEWYGIMMVKTAQASVDWEYVRDHVCDKCPQWTRA